MKITPNLILFHVYVLSKDRYDKRYTLWQVVNSIKSHDGTWGTKIKALTGVFKR